MTGIRVKYSTKDRYIYISVLTSNTSFPFIFHFLKNTKIYKSARTAKSIRYFMETSG